MMVWVEAHGMVFEPIWVAALCVVWVFLWFLVHSFMPAGVEGGLKVGAHVYILKNPARPKLDGAEGVCEEWEEEQERWKVRINDSGEVVLMRPNQIALVSTKSAAAAPQLAAVAPPTPVSHSFSRTTNLSGGRAGRSPAQSERSTPNTARRSSDVRLLFSIGSIDRGRQGRRSCESSTPVGHAMGNSMTGDKHETHIQPRRAPQWDLGAQRLSYTSLTMVQQHAQSPVYMRPAIYSTAMRDIRGLQRLRRALSRQLIYSAAALLFGAAVVIQGLVVTGSSDYVLVSYFTCFHQALFAMSCGHHANSLWEDARCSHYLGLGIGRPGVVLCPFGRCFLPPARWPLWFGVACYRVVMLASFGYMLWSGNLGGVGLQLVLYDASSLLPVWRDLSFSAKITPDWMRSLSRVARYWRLSYAMLVAFRTPVLFIWVLGIIDPGALGEVTENARSAFLCLGVFLFVANFRGALFMYGHYCTDYEWALAYTKKLQAQQAQEKTALGARPSSHGGRSAGSIFSGSDKQPESPSKVLSPLAARESRTEEEAREVALAAKKVDALHDEAADDCGNLSLPVEVPIGRVRNAGVGGRLVHDTNAPDFLRVCSREPLARFAIAEGEDGDRGGGQGIDAEEHRDHDRL